MENFDKTQYTKEQLDEIYRNMDYIANMTYINIYSLSKDTDIYLNKVDFNNEEHLFFINICYVMRSITQKRIYCNGNIFKLLRFNIENRKAQKFISPFFNKQRKSIDIDEVLEFMRPVLKERLNLISNPNFGMIYKEYYTKG